jgi:hypothetical protein
MKEKDNKRRATVGYVPDYFPNSTAASSSSSTISEEQVDATIELNTVDDVRNLTQEVVVPMDIEDELTEDDLACIIDG